MLAQLNSKQKSLFFNIKPTVIDKLISKNKSSIQNSLLYTNEDSDGSLSEESEDSSSSSQENSLTTSLQHSAAMAPIRRSEKVNVLGSKLSSKSQFAMKRGPGRPPNRQVAKASSNLKILAAKKVLENSKKGAPKKLARDVQTAEKVKQSDGESSTPGNTKYPQKSLKKDNLPSVAGRRSVNTSNPVKSSVKRGRPKLLNSVKPVGKSENKTPLTSQSNTVALLSSKSSPRKFPSNIVDRWKSTGMVIRGRGRPKGSSRGSLRGGIRRVPLRAERYNTRDSQIGLMRSGKRRKCSDPNLIEGLEGIKKRRKVVNRIKKEKSDYPSDEHSSFVTISELSFCDNENSLKQSDDEISNTRLVKVKIENEETEDEITNSRDTNSNVFKSDKKINKKVKASSSGSDTNDQSNIPNILKKNSVRAAPADTFRRGRKNLMLLEKKVVICQSDSSVRDSDCSLDSDLTEDLTNSPKTGLKRHRRKGVDGLWVRRSTRSVGKNNDKAETDAIVIEEILKEKDFIVDVDSNSKCSLNIDTTTCDSSLQSDDTAHTMKKSPKFDSSKTVIEKSVKENTKSDSFVSEHTKSVDTLFSSVDSKDVICTDHKKNANSDPLVDFTLTFEETPVKNTGTTSDMKPEKLPKLHFDSSQSDLDILTSIKIESDSTFVSNNVASQTIISTVKDVSVEKTKVSISKDLESDVSEFPKCQSNNNYKLLVNVESIGDKEQIICLRDKEKNIEASSVNIAHKHDCEGGLLDKIDDRSGEFEVSGREIISDEKILSMIDSFCQSDSTDGSIIEEAICKGSTAVGENDENIEEIILDSVNKITSEVESKLLEEEHVKQLLNDVNKPTELDEIHQKNKSNVYNIKHIQPIDEELEDTNAEGKDTRTRFLTGEKLLNCEELQIKNNFENSVKMEIDIDCVDKAPESTEESSSSDSNSNLSELMSTPLDNDSGRVLQKQPGELEHLVDNETNSEKLQIENTEACSEPVINEIASSLQIEREGFPVVSSETSNNALETNTVMSSSRSKLSRNSSFDDSVEARPSKELLSALGLQSLHSVAEEKPKRPTDSYTGTLKAVIKLNRSSDKRSGGRKMIFKQGDKLVEDSGGGGDRLEYRICSAEELSTEGVPLTHLADIPANRKTQMKVKSQFDLSNSPNIVGAAGSMETPASSDSTKEAGGKQNLIIPEKSSSFSIHPERLCTDVCSYCFGKFGSLDTPCHLAQLKNAERQAKILAIEVHLSADSCLCDGCFRYVDRKANCPASQRSRKPAARRGPLAGTICAVQDCTQPARHSVRRKWLIKLKKSIGKKLVIDMDKNPHLPFPLCSQHYYWVDYFTVCGICKKRLTRNHMYALGPEADELNQALSDDGIPVRLSDKLFLCKLCRYYSSLRLKYRDPATMSSNHRLFFHSYRKKILHYHDIPVSYSEEEGKSVEEDGGSSEIPKSKKKKSKTKSLDGHESKKRSTDKEGKSDPGNEDRSNDSQMIDYSYLETLNVHREEPTTPTVDYSALGDFEGQVGFSSIASFLNPLEGGQGTVYPPDSQNRSRAEKPTRIQVKFGNLNIGKLSNLNIGQDTRPASSVTPALERPPYLPGERDLKLSGEFEFHGSNPSCGWERCTSTIQFDRDTKKLWQELQRPYGNQSSFLRHLVILEKHWRNGSLVLAENPNPKAAKYINSVTNRVQAYDGAKTAVVSVEKPKQPEVTLTTPPRPMSTPLKTTSAPPPLMKIAPGSTPWLQDQLKKPPPYNLLGTSTAAPTNSRLVSVPAPPPYRFPVSRPGPRSMRMPAPSSVYTQSGRGQHCVKPVSISYQQFKKIRLEQPSSTVTKVTVVPKIEPLAEAQSTSTSPSMEFQPRICDVRSLATSQSDWTESFRKQQQKMFKQNVAKYYPPILPKIPHSLTVTTYPQTTAVLMKTSSLTIEKAPNVSTKPNIAPPEKPSISVFRETTPSENG